MVEEAEPEAIERKWVLSKIAAGDYLLPSNDGRTLWRITRYVDGPSAGLDIPRDRDFWAVRHWQEEVGRGDVVDVEDWDRWVLRSDMWVSRAAAIDAALRSEAAWQ